MMNKKHKIILVAGFALGVLLLLVLFLLGSNVAVLNPQGSIAAQQRDLMVIATLLMLVVVLPVFVMTFAIAWKFRASNMTGKYEPNWDHDSKLEAFWWGVPLIIITALSVIIWISSHQLDPYKPISSDKEPITVQVVALQWKWLFIYPEHGIASVNYVQFPKETPVNFHITADAPMNSFWIPQLGGQVYAMSGMTTKLHLLANETGRYNGVSANLSGEGFSGMKFIAASTTQSEFDEWVDSVKRTADKLTINDYQELAKPSKDVAPVQYTQPEEDLYDTIIMKYMSHDSGSRSLRQKDKEAQSQIHESIDESGHHH